MLRHIVLLGLLAGRVSAADTNYATLVDPRIGTAGSGLGCGFTFVGAAYPFGMVQFTPSFFANNRGFVVNQLSGAGCPQLGNFPTLPIAGELRQSPRDMTGFKPLQLKAAHAGFIATETSDGVVFNGTVTRRTGVAEFIFPSSQPRGTVLIGASSVGEQRSFYNAHVRVTSPTTCEGYSQGNNFCGAMDIKYPVYFAAEFSRPASRTGTWKDGDIVAEQQTVGGGDSGAYFTFDTTTDPRVEYRIAISYISVANARENLRRDDNKAGFAALRSAAEAAWDKRLGMIEVSRENPDRVTQFYTHLYHALIHPNLFSDVNGEYLGADFAVHKTARGRDAYTSFSGWDTYRTQCQLAAMLCPDEASDMMQSAVDFAGQAGAYGRWIMANIETGVMQGDPMPIIIANSWAFGARNFDTREAFKYMKLGATVPGLRSQTVVVRHWLEHYLAQGHTFNASETLEFNSADFAIGQFALQALGDKAEAARFINRSQSWKKLWDVSTGWLRSRNPTDGKWLAPDEGWREATKKNYFWLVPFNLNGLIETTIGRDAAIARLDEFFVRLDASYEQDWFAGGNEPNFQAPWVYNWAGKPAKTSHVIHRLFTELYNSTPSGCPGNDDLGAMGAFYVFCGIGMYPVIPGVAGFALNTPQFERINLNLPAGRVAITRAGTGLYINALTVNGRSHDTSWLDWSAIQKGGTLRYQVTTNAETPWATTAKLPSYDGF